jgi:hypothetical protein
MLNVLPNQQPDTLHLATNTAFLNSPQRNVHIKIAKTDPD